MDMRSIVACLIVLTASANEEYFSLAQRHAHRINRKLIASDMARNDDEDRFSLLQVGQKALPEVSTLIKAPQHVLRTLNSQISSLEEGLAEKDEQSMQAVKQFKANYENQLKAQDNENENMHRMNKKLGMQSEELHERNVALRKEAKALEAEIGKLEADLNTLKINMSTGQEFAALAFKSSGAMLANATALKILDELEDEEIADRNNQLHQELLKQVGKSPSFLQVAAAGTTGPKNPQKLIESLMASLNDLSQEQNITEASLNRSFEQEFKAGADKHHALVEKQAKINATIADGEALHDKLRAAVSHLKATRDGLLEKSRSLRSYAKQMANAQEFSKSLSLLQLDAARHSPTSLPGVPKVLSKPTEIYQLMNSHVNRLGERLSEVEQQTVPNVTTPKGHHEEGHHEEGHHEEGHHEGGPHSHRGYECNHSTLAKDHYEKGLKSFLEVLLDLMMSLIGGVNETEPDQSYYSNTSAPLPSTISSTQSSNDTA